MKIAAVVLYLVVTIAMSTFIMLQRASGANAGSGFGAGASGTVFGARGSANFLSSATKWLAVAFFALSLGMAVYDTRVGSARQAEVDLGVMGGLAPASETPAAPDAAVPASGDLPPPAVGDLPAAPAASTRADPAAATPEVESATPQADMAAAPEAAQAVPTVTPDESKPEEKQP